MKTYLTKNSVKASKSVTNRTMCKFGKSFAKRTLATVLSAGMLLSGMPAVFGEAYKAPDSVIDYFETFHGFVKTENTDITNISMPDGWTTANYSADRRYFQSGYQDTETGSNILKSRDSTLVYKFDEAIKDGVLHISFDAKMDSDTVSEIGGFNTSVNDNTNDYWNQDLNGQAKSRFMKFKSDGESNSLYVPEYAASAAEDSDQKVGKDNQKWHKYDIYVNFDKNINDNGSHGSYELFIDGEQAVETAIQMTSPNAYKAYNGLKGIYIYTMWGENNKIPHSYFDNFYIHHYKTADDVYEAPRVAIDYANTGIDPNNGTVDVVFSEALNQEIEFSANQFNIKNISTGETKRPESVDYVPQTTGARLTLPKLDEGEYEISVSKDVKGAKSGKSVSNTAKFNISGGGKIGESQRVYINENFNTYKGGMPAEFKDMDSKSAANMKAAVVSDNDTALKMNGAAAVSYEFNNKISSGKFTVEFDVKQSGGAGWSVGLMDEADFFTDKDYISLADYEQEKNNVTYAYWNTKADKTTYPKFNEWANAKTLDPNEDDAAKLTNKEYYFKKWTTEQAAGEKNTENPTTEWMYKRINDKKKSAKNNTLISNVLKDDENRTKLYTAKARSNYGDTELTDVTAAADTVTKVKAVVDLDGGKYNFYINGSETPITVEYNNATDGNYSNGRFARTYFRDTEGNYKVLGGIMGLRLQKDGAGSVEFDNIKVYTDNSYNDYLDFNTQKQGATQPGWYSNKAVTWNNLQYFGHNGEDKRVPSDGLDVANNTGDKAMEFTTGWQFFTHPIAVPVKANTAFSVEFDLKATGNDRWILHLLDDRYMVRNKDNSNTTLFNGETGVAGKQDKHIMEQNGILTNVYKVKDATANSIGFATPSGSNYSPQYPEDFTSVGVTYTTDKWQHIKLNFVPVASSKPNEDPQMKLTLTVTCDGQTYTGTEQWLRYSWYESGKSRLNKYDVCGIGFQIPSDNNSKITIDNLKITETKDAYKAAVTSIKTKNQMGQEYDLTDKVYANEGEQPKININFSDTLNNTDDVKDVIKLYYPEDTADAAPGYDVNVSEDKKYATVTLTDYQKDKNITMYVSNKASVGSSYLSAMDTTSKTFTVTQPEDKLEVTDFRLYKYVEGRSVGEKSCDGAWVPVTDTNIGSESFDTYKLILKGYNSGSSKEVSVITATYGNDNKDLLSGLVTSKQIIPVGEFDNIEYTITNSGADAAKLKAFIWDMEDGLKPLWDNLEYTRTVTESAGE